MRWQRILIVSTATLALLSMTSVPIEASDPVPAKIGPRIVRKNHYIVVLKGLAGLSSDPSTRSASIRAFAANIVGGSPSSIKAVYANGLTGFSARLSRGRAARVAADPRVESVVPDGYAYVTQTIDLDATCRRQNAPPSWGVDRLDERGLPMDDAFKYYWNGSGVNVYVIDSGISTSHSDFGGRAQNVFSVDTKKPADCLGHGTHVAGTIGGASFGVAKAARLWGVKVFPGCTDLTTWSDVIRGIDWVVGNHVKPAVVNMSLGGPSNAAVDLAVQAGVRAGITFVVSAGNEGGDVQGFSPARVAEAITVGATDRNDAAASWSNHGAGVDLHAPGVGITSATIGSGSPRAVLSGTSMASPHVAGIAAAYLEVDRGALPSTVQSAVLNVATAGVVRGLPAGTPNRLAYSRRQCPVACGDGFINQASEQCEPPGSRCANGQTCTSQCICSAPPTPVPPRPECRVDLCNGSSSWTRDAYGNPDQASCVAWAWATARLYAWQKPTMIRFGGAVVQQNACDCCAKCANRSGAYNMGVSQSCASVAGGWCSSSGRGGLDTRQPDYNPGAFWGACPAPPSW